MYILLYPVFSDMSFGHVIFSKYLRMYYFDCARQHHTYSQSFVNTDTIVYVFLSRFPDPTFQRVLAIVCTRWDLSWMYGFQAQLLHFSSHRITLDHVMTIWRPEVKRHVDKEGKIFQTDLEGCLQPATCPLFAHTRHPCPQHGTDIPPFLCHAVSLVWVAHILYQVRAFRHWFAAVSLNVLQASVLAEEMPDADVSDTQAACVCASQLPISRMLANLLYIGM